MLYQFDDIEQAAEILPDLQLDYRQLGRGPIRISIRLQAVGEISVATASLNRLVEGWGHVNPGHVLFLLCTGGQADNHYDSYRLCPGQAYLKIGGTPPGQQLLKPGYQATLLTLPVRLVENQLGRPLDSKLGNGAVADLAPSVLSRTIDLIHASQSLEGPNQRHLSDLLAGVLCSGLSLGSDLHNFSKPDGKTMLARAIRERLADCPEMTLGDICGALCISERTLRRVFSEVYDISPGQYNIILRLNHVRRDLRQGRLHAERTIISNVAARHGFWHMGHFCTQYRRLFGETPSQTICGLALGPNPFPAKECQVGQIRIGAEG